MKTLKVLQVLSLALLVAQQTLASTLYVDLNNPNPTAPYSDWSTAATNIQDAIDASTSGDQILVTNGVYQTGGKVMAGDLTNRIALNKAVTVQSINGPWATIIQGGSLTNGTAAVRCAWLTNGASLIGFTLRGGGTRKSGDISMQSGGAIWCASSNALVSTSLICSNTAAIQGGGVYQGSLRNCAIFGNISSQGSGTCNSVLINCTVAGNVGSWAVYQGRFTNCIVYANSNMNYNAASGSFSYCCTSPMPSGGIGNFTTSPQLFADNVHLLSSSPCIGAGINMTVGTDIDGRSWANPPSVGCSEWSPDPLVGQSQIKLASSPVGFTVNAAVTGGGNLSCWWLKDGIPLQNNAHFSSTQTTNLIATGVSFADAGDYQLVASNAFGAVTSSVAPLVIHCVDVAGLNPNAPYLSWQAAATNIQDAITASAAGEVVLVTNGLYATGGKSMDGVITNRISMDKDILVKSMNGPAATIIQGAWDPISTNGLSAVRCAWMTNNAILNGFTLRGGATRVSSSSASASSGGGIYGAVANKLPKLLTSTATDCVLLQNAAVSGGAAYQVNLENCTIVMNAVIAGSGTTYGGGAYGCNLRNCVIASNTATGSNSSSGGGVYSCNLWNCLVAKNSAVNAGGGAYLSTLINCSLIGNQVGNASYFNGSGGGAANCSLTNCIVYYNTAFDNTASNSYGSTLSYSCTTPPVSGTGNIAVDPQLLADGIHLSITSPCRGAGMTNWVSGTDIDGQPWSNPPSIGCDEWQPAPVVSIAPVYHVIPPHGLTFSAIAAGQPPFTCFWVKDGIPIQDDEHYTDAATADLIVNNFGPADSGLYQVVVSNSFGVATSQLAQVVIHGVDAAGVNPIAPYSSWDTAANNIQDAINVASVGDIVLVTNGIYATGGKVVYGDLTNRVAVDKAITVQSVNGYSKTVIQGAWDPVSTNGPGAVRCAYLADGAKLNGFTLQHGATRASDYIGGPLASGGGVLCDSVNGIVSNCVLTNNCAVYGGGISFGTLNNSFVSGNLADYGGGTYFATINNCTVADNYVSAPFNRGGGTYDGITRNSIVLNNYGLFLGTINNVDNHWGDSIIAHYFSTCTSPTTSLSGTGNTNFNPQFLDSFHIASTSPAVGAGNPAFSSGTDLDGEPWNNPPSMGCDEVVAENLVGPLSVNILAYQTNLLVNHPAFFKGIITGHVSRVEWSFGDGTTITNSGAIVHQWTNSGNYTVIFTAYNNDNPAGVSASTNIFVQPLDMPQLQSAVLLTNGFQFQFTAQLGAMYTIQFATNLVPPVAWQTLQIIYSSPGGMTQIIDATVPTETRFYRIFVWPTIP